MKIINNWTQFIQKFWSWDLNHSKKSREKNVQKLRKIIIENFRIVNFVKFLKSILTQKKKESRAQKSCNIREFDFVVFIWFMQSMFFQLKSLLKQNSKLISKISKIWTRNEFGRIFNAEREWIQIKISQRRVFKTKWEIKSYSIHVFMSVFQVCNILTSNIKQKP